MVPFNHHETHLVCQRYQTQILVKHMEYFKLHFEYFIFTVGIVCSFYEVYYAWTVYFFLF